MQNNGINIKQITGNKSKFGNKTSISMIRYIPSLVVIVHIEGIIVTTLKCKLACVTLRIRLAKMICVDCFIRLLLLTIRQMCLKVKYRPMVNFLLLHFCFG